MFGQSGKFTAARRRRAAVNLPAWPNVLVAAPAPASRPLLPDHRRQRFAGPHGSCMTPAGQPRVTLCQLHAPRSKWTPSAAGTRLLRSRLSLETATHTPPTSSAPWRLALTAGSKFGKLTQGWVRN